MPQENPFFRRFSTSRQGPPPWQRWLGAVLGLIALAVIVYNIPWVHSRLAWRIDNLRQTIAEYFNPPSEAVFAPAATLEAQPTRRPTSTAQPGEPGPTPLPTFAPIPESVTLEGFTFVSQQGRWNYCGPSTLTMALNFWGWSGTADDVAEVVKPGENNPSMNFVERGRKDKNVMPYELLDFVNDDTQYSALTRMGGNIDLVKQLIANGFPVVIEKGYYEADYRGIVDWLGHYLFVTGYDDARQTFIVQDTWDKNHPGENQLSPYDEFIEGWRSFNYLFMVVYPRDRETEVLDLLGPWADEEWADRHSLEVAQAEAEQLTGIDQFFAWFNVGTGHVLLFEYADAANAYDYAFQLYASLDDAQTKRPYRMMWYQTWPYWAYYYSGRYQDVISLANTVVDDWSGETLEETLYWRGLAEQAIGETGNAVADFQQAVYLNPNFAPGWAILGELGVSP